MNYKIIVDSCCDLTKKLRQKLNVITVPLTLRLGEKEYTDDANLNLPDFMKDMKACTQKVGSAAPSPGTYAEAFEQEGAEFAITLSSQLSGSYASAMAGKSEAADSDVHVFDSKSASAGEALLAIKLQEYIQSNLPKTHIIEKMNDYINKMKTYFVLENYDNLQKNGRLGKIAGKIVSLLGIRLIMGSDGNGKIKMYDKARGENQIMERLLSLIKDSKKETKEETLVISHCNNLGFAERFADVVKKQFRFKEIYIVPTAGVSSLYADNQGIVMAF